MYHEYVVMQHDAVEISGARIGSRCGAVNLLGRDWPKRLKCQWSHLQAMHTIVNVAGIPSLLEHWYRVLRLCPKDWPSVTRMGVHMCVTFSLAFVSVLCTTRGYLVLHLHTPRPLGLGGSSGFVADEGSVCVQDEPSASSINIPS